MIRKQLKIPGHPTIWLEGTRESIAQMYELNLYQMPNGVYMLVTETHEKYPQVCGTGSSGGSLPTMDGFHITFKKAGSLCVMLEGRWTTSEFDNRYGPTWLFIKSEQHEHLKHIRSYAINKIAAVIRKN